MIKVVEERKKERRQKWGHQFYYVGVTGGV
jgi:hypothetical protein